MEKTISLEDLAKHAERIARDVETTGTVYRIKRGGRRTLVLVDIAAWRVLQPLRDAQVAAGVPQPAQNFAFACS